MTALATGLGVLPFLRRRPFDARSLGVANAAAAGLMGAASGGLIYEGLSYSPARVGLGFLLGLGFIAVSSAIVERNPAPEMD